MACHGHLPLFSYISKPDLASVSTTPLELEPQPSLLAFPLNHPLPVSLISQPVPRAAVRRLTDLSPTARLNLCLYKSPPLLPFHPPP